MACSQRTAHSQLLRTTGVHPFILAVILLFAFQLVINRQTGNVEAIKRFADNSSGRKLRAWSRFLHTGEEFGIVGQIIATMACIGAIVLVWTGLSMAVRRALSTRTLRDALATPVAKREGVSALD